MDDDVLVKAVERQVVELVASAKGLLKEFEGRIGESIHAQRLQASEARAEGARVTKILEELSRHAGELVKYQRDLVTKINAEWKQDIVETAKQAGAAQSQAFGEAIGAGLRKQLATVTGQVEAATKRMDWKGVVRAAGVGAGCSLGVMVAVVALLMWYVPSKAEMDSLRAERTQLQATVDDLTKRGGKISLSTCGDTKRVCVRVDAVAGRFGDVQHGEVYMIALGY